MIHQKTCRYAASTSEIRLYKQIKFDATKIYLRHIQDVPTHLSFPKPGYKEVVRRALEEGLVTTASRKVLRKTTK